MKHLTLTLLLTVFVLSSGATQRLVVRQINSDYVFAQNDEILTIRETIRMLPAGSESQQLLKSSRFYTFTGQLLSLSGGALIGTAVTDVILNTYGEAERTALWLIAGTGAAFVAVGLPLARVGDRRVQRAVALVNGDISYITPGRQGPNLRLVAGVNGVGLALRF